MRTVQNNSGLWCQRETTQFRLENENSEPQMWDKHGHFCRLPLSVILNLSSNYKNSCALIGS